MISISELRDYIIVFGTILVTIFIFSTTILSYVIFKRLKKILNYVDNSISGPEIFIDTNGTIKIQILKDLTLLI